jgi:hypothetical protein
MLEPIRDPCDIEGCHGVLTCTCCKRGGVFGFVDQFAGCVRESRGGGGADNQSGPILRDDQRPT